MDTATVSLTYVPMMTSLVLSRKTGHEVNISDRIMAFIQRLYNPTIRFALQHRRLVVGGAVAVLAGSLWIFSTLGGEFIPTLDEGDFAVETRLLTGSSLGASIETTQKAARVLLDHFPEVENVMGKIGSAEIPTDPMPMEASDLMVVLKDHSEWTSAATRDELAEKMSAKLEEHIPGVSFGFQQPIQMQIGRVHV